ncbi:MAG: hypothetical protein RL060_1167 [Bacteroidota bacterium]|jgi:hypothetical protein
MFKLILSSAIAVLLLTINALAQSSYVQFTYDARGNRTGRQIVFSTERLSQEQSSASDVFKDQIGLATVQIYPNPVHNSFKVSIQDSSITTGILGTIKVMDSRGNAIGENTIKDGYGEFDMANQPTGTYLIQINYHDKNIVWKALKQ